MNEEPVRGIGPLVQRYRRLDAGEPPARVDAAVRDRARAAARRRRAAAWSMPAALAATLLVAFSVVLNLPHDAPPPAVESGPAAARVLQEATPPAPPPAPPAPMSAPATAGITAEESAIAGDAMTAPMRERTRGAEREASPEAWLERIAQLEAAGRHEEADAERRRLEAAHPGWLARHAGQRD